MTSAVHSLRVAAPLALLAAGPAGADSWSLTPALQTTVEHRSNPLFVDGGASGQLASFDLGAAIAWRAESLSANIDPRVSLARDAGAARSSANVYGLQSSLTRSSERSALSLSYGWADESTLDAGLDAATLVNVDTRRQRHDASLSASHALSERLGVSASLSWQSTSYDELPSLRLFDFEDLGASLMLSRDVSETMALSASVGSSRYASQAFAGAQRSDSVSVGITGNWSAQTRWSADYGWSRDEVSGTRSAGSGAIYRAELAHQRERGSVLAKVEQSVQPSGFGSLTRARVAEARYDWRHDPRWSLSLSGTAARNRGGTPAEPERVVRTVGVGATFLWSEQWTLTGGLSWQEQRVSRDAPLINGVGLALTAQRTFAPRRF